MEEKDKKGHSFFDILGACIYFFDDLFDSDSDFGKLGCLAIFLAPVIILSFGLFSKSNLDKFNSIDVDMAAAGINKSVLQQDFKKDPLTSRKAVERHKRKRFMLINRQQEEALSSQMVSKMKELDILYKDKKLEKRCNSILARLVKVMPEGFNPPKQIYILDTKEVNAVCLPDGTIVVFRGMAEQFSDEELAWVIAHELGHGTAHHAAEMLSKTMIQELAIKAFIDKDSSLFKIVGTHLVKFFANLKYSRVQEDEADRLGLYYMNKAGFDMNGAISVLNKFNKERGKKSAWKELISSHPHPENRLKNAEAAIKDLKKNPDLSWGGLKDDMIEGAKVKAIEYYMKKQKK